MALDISRHRELIDTEKFNTPVHIIGCGATGSYVALALGKLGIKNLHVYDFDIVEAHNIANQSYDFLQIGENKTKALFDQIYCATGGEVVHVHNIRFKDQRVSGYVFLLVDSMEQRKIIWENALKMKTSIELLIEPRLGIDAARIYNVEPCNLNHIKKYEDSYSYGDDTAEVSACGTSMTVVTSVMSLAGWCVRQLISHFNKEELDNEILLDFKYNNIVGSRW